MMTGQTLGPYRILAKLGEGGMGVVYRAHDPRLDRDVALKLLPAEYAADADRRARFDREARAAAALNHPNICTIHEVGEVDGQVYIAMELLDGATLSECLATGPAPMATAEALDIGIQIADALNAAREKHIVHRDLKSGNIVLLPRGQVKVLDFGLAKRARDVPPDAATDLAGAVETRGAVTGLTEVGAVIGTVAYMSPEQALGEPVDHRSDLFSFGVVLYELLTGRLPFAGRTHTAMIDAVLHGEPEPIPRFNEQVPDALVAVVKRLLEKDRERRYQSAADALADLRRIKDDLAAGRAPTSSAQVPASTQTPTWSRWPVRLALAVVVISVVAFAGWRWATTRTGPIDLTRAASLVALPARVQGPPDVQQQLIEGLPNAVSGYLAGVKGLDTKVPPTSAEFDRLKGDALAVARAYRVDLCLLMSVTAQGPQLLLTLQLEDPATRSMVWSATYQGTQAGYLTLVKDAADGVRAALRPAAAPVVAPARQTTDAGALLALQRGQYYSNRYNNKREAADFDRALASFNEALRLDPKLADAAAEAALLFGFKAESGATLEVVTETERWGAQTVALDPRNGKGWTARVVAEAFRPTPDLRKMREYAFRGAALAPRSANVQLVAVIYTSVGPVLALAGAREVCRLDPLYQAGAGGIAVGLYMLGRSEEALQALDAADAIEPGGITLLTHRPLMLADLRRIGPATAALSDLRNAVSTGRIDQWALLAAEPGVLLEQGNTRAALAAFTKLQTLLQDPGTPAGIAEGQSPVVVPFLARHGRVNEAFQFMQLCMARGFPPNYDWLVLDPRISSLRADPRFAAILATSRAQFVTMLNDVDAARSRGEFPAYLEQPLKEMRAKLGM
jgi:eukaryotic-like serine/threonine-protein kinase